MKRVLHLIDSLSPGGAERVAANLFNHANQQGQATWLCATRHQGALQENLLFPERYHFLGKKHTFDLRAFFRLLSWIKQQKIDVIHAHAGSVYWAVALKWLSRCRLVWHDHHGNRTKTGLLHRRLLRVLSRYFDATIGVNQPMLDWHRQYLKSGIQNTRLIRHFAVLPLPHPLPERLQPGVVRIVCVANLRPEKGHLTLISALALLVRGKNQAPFQVKLIGQTPDAAYLQQLKAAIQQAELQQWITLEGPRSDIAQHLLEADIGVLSSDWEGLPLALLEYGLAGLACVCTDVGDCRNVLDGGRAGLLVPPGRPEALADALAVLLQDDGLRKRLGERLRQNVVANYSAEHASTSLNDLYQTLAPR